MREHLPVGAKIWQYEVEQFLGEGTFAATYLAHHVTMTKRKVAIKQLKALHSSNPGTVKRFIREAYAMAELCHPNIVTIFELVDPEHCIGENNYSIVMEFMDGGTLEELMNAGTLAVADAIRITKGMLMGLSVAHQENIIHRDIKPANILLNRDRTVVKLGDWGLAHLDVMKMTILGSKMGTLQYMPPEQARGDSRLVDGRSDLYSVGAVLYEMVTGKPYLDLDSIAEAAGMRFVFQHQEQTMDHDALQAVAQQAAFEAIEKIDPEPPIKVRKDLPASLSALIMKSLAKDPAARFQTAQAFIDALNDVQLAPSRRQQPAVFNTDSSEQIATLLVRARHERLQSNYTEAFKLLQQARQIEPFHAGVCLELAHIYNRMCNYEEAIKILDQAHQHNPDNYIILRDLGFTHAFLKDWNKAGSALRDALRLNPNQSEVIKKVNQIDRRING